MKRLLLSLLLTSCLLLPDARGQQTAYLHLTADQLPGTVTIDSVKIPPTRDTLVAISPGKHCIRAATPFRTDWLLRDFQKSILVGPLDTASVAIIFPKYFILYSQPMRSFVWIGDSLLGRTPLLANWETLKNKSIRIENRGYFTKQFNLQSLNQEKLTIRLKKDPHYWQKFNWLRRKKQLQKKRLLWGAACTGGAALASGVAAYFLKKKANAAYNDYLKTPFPDEIKKDYNRAQHYDTYAGTTYLIFEINLISSAILLLKAVGK